MLILNDVHAGFHRAGGTTPASHEAMRTYLFSSFRSQVESTTEDRICILGDLFDDFEVDTRDWIETYLILTSFAKIKELILVAGNHDQSSRGLKVSSFEMLCQVLKNEYPRNVGVVGIDQFYNIGGGVWALAHCSSQVVFEDALTSLLGFVKPGDTVLLHANFNNNFAAQSDHSLNVTIDMAQKYQAAGATLIFAHEHQARTALDGAVVVLGNQWPTSVSDCLGNDKKYAHILTPGVTAIKYETWSRLGEDGYAEVDWRELPLTTTQAKFIRVTGEASSNEAADVMNTIAKYRNKSSCFVITNAVRIDGVAETEALPEAFEATKAFDVLEFISKHLDDAEMVAVRALVEETQ